MEDELKHECAVAMVVLRRPPSPVGDYGGTKLSLLLEKQHNRGQDGAGAAILSDHPSPGETPYWIAKSASASPLVDILGAMAKRVPPANSTLQLRLQFSNSNSPAPTKSFERIFLGHLRYATFGKNNTTFCHPFVHEASDLAHTLLLAGNFNLTNTSELFENYSTHGSFPTSKADGYLITELISKELACGKGLSESIASALADADGAWTLCGMTGDGWAFATRDPHGIRPGFYYVDDNVVVVASERPAIQAAFDVPPAAVKELPPGEALIVSPGGEVEFCDLDNRHSTPDSSNAASNQTTKQSNNQTIIPTPCAFERIYFSRANDADVHRERKALGVALLPQILEAADAPLEDIFFSYIPNSARIAFHGLLEGMFKQIVSPQESSQSCPKTLCASASPREISLPRFGEVIVKDAKFRTFIADAGARREFYKHIYDVTYGLVRPGRDTLVVLDDSIVRGNTMKNAILPMLDRLGPKRVVIASSAPPIRYPDCYGIDMSTLGELVAFRALVNLLNRGGNAEAELRTAMAGSVVPNAPHNPLASLYSRFSDAEHCAEIARLLTPPGIKAEVIVVYQTVPNLRKCLLPPPNLSTFPPFHYSTLGDWYFTGDYPTSGGYKVLQKAISNYLDKNSERSY